jgi:two-component SAPR family response regulator
MMAETLTELGFEVIGPFGKVRDALAVIERDPVDFAFLNMNLGGELADPIAGALRSRDIPFAFATGYGSGLVSAGFPGIVVLQKPVERDAMERILASHFPELD